MSKRKRGESLRIIWAITAKDIAEAVTNRTTLSITLGVLVLILSGQALPLLLRLSASPTVIVYDAGRSALIAGLKKSRDLRLGVAKSPQDLDERVGEASAPVLGLVLPADFDQAVQAGEPVELQGFFAHWVQSDDADELRAFFEERLTDLTGQPVQIQTAGNRVYPAPHAGGQPWMASMTLVLVVMTIGSAVAPHLLIEEKQAHTLDALLVSPASISQVVAGKALVGTLLALTAAAVALLFSWRLVVHWELVLLAMVSTALFAVALGLLFGCLFDNPQTLALWFGAVLAALLVPVFLVGMPGLSTSPLLKSIAPYVPTAILSDIVRFSFSNHVPWGDLLTGLGIVLLCTIVLLGAVVWKVRRSDR
jgi:ABC-2 type transport system permease protein